MQAQITPDTTLPTNSIVTSQGNTIVITGGSVAGSNLFHSFREFSVTNGNTAFFNNSTTIQNILSRVTGAAISNIDGLIKANGTANLFLINPNGIILGENAKLQIGGSFLASSAASFKFADGLEFSATNPTVNPLLSINVPLGLQFGNNPGSITNRSLARGDDGVTAFGFQPQIDRTVALVGGDVLLEGGIFAAERGRVELGSVKGNGQVGLVFSDLHNFALNYDVSQNFGDIRLAKGALVGASGDRGGSIQVQGRNIELTGGSQIFAATFGAEQGGNIQIQGKDIKLSNGSQIFTATTGSGIGGNIFVNATNDIDVSGRDANDNFSAIFTFAGTASTGKAGDASLLAQNLRITNGAFVGSPTFGAGSSGDISILAADSVEVSGRTSSNLPSTLTTNTLSGTTGNAGNISIAAARLLVTDGAQLNANSNGLGNAGKINVLTTDKVEVSGTSATGNSSTFGTIGKGGQVNVETGIFSVLNGATVQARDSSLGELGLEALRIVARDRIDVIGQAPVDSINSAGEPIRFNSQISTATFNSSAKDSGSMTLIAKILNIKDGGSINSTTFNQVRGGDINIRASEKLEINGRTNSFPSQIDSASGSELSLQSGRGGDIKISTPDLLITNGGEISTRSFAGDSGNILIDVDKLSILAGSQISANTSDGKAGNVTVNAGLSIDIAGERLIDSEAIFSGSTISSSTDPGKTGTGGDILLRSPRLSIRDGGNISTDTLGTGNAGNIEIHANSIEVVGSGSPVFVENINNRSASQISSDSVGIGTVTGKGGNILIEADRVSVRDGGSISTETGSIGDAGSLTIRARDIVEVIGTKGEGDDRRFPSSLRTAVSNTQAVGKAGDLLIETGNFLIADGAQVLSATFGKGNAGNLTILATDVVKVLGVSPSTGVVSALSTSVGDEATGNGGNLTITAKNLLVENGGQISTATLGKGNSGNLIVKATDAVVVSGLSTFDGDTPSGMFASAESGAVGQGGTLRIETGNLLVSDRGRITVRDLSGTVGAGNLQIVANSVLLDNQASLNAETRAGVQGNIDIQSSSLQLRRNSAIAANAFGTATGGNISINSGALAALENSDINANAEQAVGGRVIINAQGIFGTAFRPGVTSASDITASSDLGAEFSGTVEIKTPDIDPSQGLVPLSSTPVDVSKLIAQRCQSDRRANQFNVTGRGGLPPNPSEVLSASRVLEDLGSHSNQRSEQISITSYSPSVHLIEAQAWIANASGDVVLIANTPLPIWRSHSDCLYRR